MTLAATFEAIDLVELLIVFGVAFGIIAVFTALYLRGRREVETEN